MGRLLRKSRINVIKENNILTYASMRNMRLNEKKCKDMVINFLKYQPTVITPIQLNGIVIDRVSTMRDKSVDTLP